MSVARGVNRAVSHSIWRRSCLVPCVSMCVALLSLRARAASHAVCCPWGEGDKIIYEYAGMTQRNTNNDKPRAKITDIAKTQQDANLSSLRDAF